MYEPLKELYNKSLSTVEIGNILEDYVFTEFKKFGPFELKKTKASGRIHGDGDLVGAYGKEEIALDCKAKSPTKNINVKGTELNKIIKQAAKVGRIGALVTVACIDDGYIKTPPPEPIVVMRLKDLDYILRRVVTETLDKHETP